MLLNNHFIVNQGHNAVTHLCLTLKLPLKNITTKTKALSHLFLIVLVMVILYGYSPYFQNEMVTVSGKTLLKTYTYHI